MDELSGLQVQVRLETTVCVLLLLLMGMPLLLLLLLLAFRPVVELLQLLVLHQLIILMKGSEVQVFGNKESQNLLIARLSQWMRVMQLMMLITDLKVGMMLILGKDRVSAGSCLLLLLIIEMRLFAPEFAKELQLGHFPESTEGQ